MTAEGLRPVPATYEYLRSAAKTFPSLDGQTDGKLLEELLKTTDSAKNLIPEMIELLGADISTQLANKVRELAEPDSIKGDRVARAAVRWAGQVDRHLNPPIPSWRESRYNLQSDDRYWDRPERYTPSRFR